MGIYIPGMEMPMSCRQCSLYLQSMDSERNVYENCAVTAKSYNWGLTTRPSDCPLIPVPPHGRLIDADKYLGTIRPLCPEDSQYACTFETVKKLMMNSINNAPTIIEAEEGET